MSQDWDWELAVTPFWQDKAVRDRNGHWVTGKALGLAGRYLTHSDLFAKVYGQGQVPIGADTEDRCGYVGWDGKFYDQNRMDDLVNTWLERNGGLPGKDEKINFSKSQSITARFHEQVFVRNTNLNPTLFDFDKLKPEVRQDLLKIAESFLSGTELNSFCEPIDELLLGSNAGYNYRPDSDLDLHIVTRCSGQDREPQLETDLLKHQARIWNLIHKPTIHGYPVEIYVQDEKELVQSSGAYSLLADSWVRHPTPMQSQTDDYRLLMLKADKLKKQIQHAIDLNDQGHAEQAQLLSTALRERLKSLRQHGLEVGGELAQENLLFKELRKTGWLDKLREISARATDRELSLESQAEYRYTDRERDDPFYQEKAVRINGKVIRLSDVPKQDRETTGRKAYTHAWHSDITNAHYLQNPDEPVAREEDGFIGWDGKFYSTPEMFNLAGRYVQSQGQPRPGERINFSRSLSPTARFHQHERLAEIVASYCLRCRKTIHGPGHVVILKGNRERFMCDDCYKHVYQKVGQKVENLDEWYYDDVDVDDPFYKEKAVKVNGKIFSVSDMSPEQIAAARKDHGGLVFHRDIATTFGHSRVNDLDDGFIGWDGKWYEKKTLYGLAKAWVDAHGEPQSGEHVKLSGSQSTTARFHSQEGIMLRSNNPEANLLREAVEAYNEAIAGGDEKPDESAIKKALKDVPGMLDVKYKNIEPVELQNLKPTQTNHLVADDSMKHAYRSGAKMPPITINQHDQILDGHHRATAALEAGHDKIWAVRVHQS